VAKEHGMEKWVASATEEKREADERMYEAFKDREAQLASRMQQWSITMDPMWMAQYEDEDIVRRRVALRPANEPAVAAL
jgi:hypothetical protein